MATLFVYRLGPIDHWDGWDNVRYHLLRDANDFDCIGPSVVQSRLEIAQLLARFIGWEGDIREGPFLSGIPWETGIPQFILAWKQNNNGETFVASPVQLTWLHKVASEMITDDGAVVDFSDLHRGGFRTRHLAANSTPRKRIWMQA